MHQFTHLHVHSHYSILDGLSSPEKLVNKAVKDGMKALALTDHGNLFGVKNFFDKAKKKGIKPILGCEAYLTPKRFEKESKNKGKRDYFHIILLAKNITGYKNLLKMISLSWTEGFYYKPRIDYELLEKYHEGIIASSACLGGEIAQAILKDDIEKAEKAVQYYKNLFGNDYYLELQRHETKNKQLGNETYEKQIVVNQQLIKLSQKYNIKLIATNDVHFANDSDAEAHDHLICITTNAPLDDPGRLHYTQEEYLKSPEEMSEIFADIPEALTNTQEIVDKIEDFELNHKPIMPDFPLPEGFTNDGEYLRYLVYEGLKTRYETITEEITNRVDFELETVINMGYPGYFLIVWDFIRQAREMGVLVGPGRGSAAGAVIAYALNITQIDPFKYELLFERFLNPERISLPDIDIDFDEEGREKLLQWVSKKYGFEKVAHLITFGTMAPKMAIRDVARIRKLPLYEADRLAKMIPATPGTTFEKAYRQVPELKKEREESKNPEIKKTFEIAEKLEGCVRQIGTHACGVIIGKDDLTEHIPIISQKDSNLLITQFEGIPAESCGMLKMDFLGLKTLPIIDESVKNVKKYKGIDIDINNIDLNDKKTLELFSRGETIGVFQFESRGMRDNLRSLKPDKFTDLIAMNALYRPGPMKYIPSYINRRHGTEKISFDIPGVEKYLKETYGITVYQEQVMILSQELAGFSKGEADTLRKAMGKKKRAIIDTLKPKFIDGCKVNKIPKDKAEKIWRDWEDFAEYAFNKSHSTCYAFLATQSAYLKAHYPHEFLIAVLDRNLNDTNKVVSLINDAKRMNIEVLTPDVNKSFEKFSMTDNSSIYFGLNAIKNVGLNVATQIIREREENGLYKDIFDFIERLNGQVVNKRALEAMAQAGALDCFGLPRSLYFTKTEKYDSFIEEIIAYGNASRTAKTKLQNSLFGDEIDDMGMKNPNIPENIPEWTMIHKLNKEREVLGIFLSSHPLDKEQTVIDLFTNATTRELKAIDKLLNKELHLIVMVSEVNHLTTKTGKPYGKIKIEDKAGEYMLTLFNQSFVKFKNYFTENYILYINGKVEKNSFREGQIEFKIKQVKLIDEFLEDLRRDIVLEMKIQDITDENLVKLASLRKYNKGNNFIQVKIYDDRNQFALRMPSRDIKLKLSSALFEYLNELAFVDYKLN